MRKIVKAAIAVGACLVLTGCPKATSVTGLVNAGFGAVGNQTIKAGDSLSPALTYYVDDGASITVTYDNGKTCTFNGPTTFLPGADGSVCEKKDHDDKKQDDEDKKQDQDQKQDQQDQSRQEQSDPGQARQQGQPSNGGTNATSGINAPAVAPTTVPSYSGISGPPVIATGVPTYTRIMSVVSNPIVTATLSTIGAVAIVKEVHDQTNGNEDDEPLSR